MNRRMDEQLQTGEVSISISLVYWYTYYLLLYCIGMLNNIYYFTRISLGILQYLILDASDKKKNKEYSMLL